MIHKSAYQSDLRFINNMADNSAKVVKMARILAILHIIVGVLLICFGIADRTVNNKLWPGGFCFGIWIGVWVSMKYFMHNL